MSRSNIQQENHIESNFILITIHMNYKQIIDYYLHKVKKKHVLIQLGFRVK